ncbi:hypothetical protein M9458_043061, partial [Cirrhinus mrigala]
GSVMLLAMFRWKTLGSCIHVDVTLTRTTDSILCYVKNCIDIVTVDECIQVYPNQKPWMNGDVRWLLKERTTAFSVAQANLERGIRQAKLDHRRRIEDHLDSNNNRQVWQGVQHLTNYRINIGAAEDNASVAEEPLSCGPQQFHPH